MPAPNPARQRAARETLAELFARPSSVFVIHYSCQDLDAEDASSSPRITAIAACNLASGDTSVFSIHIDAEVRRLGPVQILSQMDELERSMLGKFFAFLAAHRGAEFVHWNMRGSLSGFAAIERRYRVLGRGPFCLRDGQKLDMARLFLELFGSGYAESPILESLAQWNNLDLEGYLPGAVEEEAFERGNYALVQRSVLAKVRLRFDILQLAADGRLRTRATWWALNSGRIREAVELLEDYPLRAAAALGFAGVSAGFFAVWRLI